MIYAYLRVSTQGQTVENQRFGIEQAGFKVDEWYEEKKSGVIDYKKRSLNSLLQKLKKGDLLVCSELSRLGRNLYMIMEILNILVSKEVSLVTIKENFRLDNSVNSKVLSFAFGLVAEIERTLISERVKEALHARVAEGKHIGRPKGAKNKIYKLDIHKDKIIKMRGYGMSCYRIAKKLKIDYINLYNYVRRLNL